MHHNISVTDSSSLTPTDLQSHIADIMKSAGAPYTPIGTSGVSNPWLNKVIPTGQPAVIKSTLGEGMGWKKGTIQEVIPQFAKCQQKKHRDLTCYGYRPLLEMGGKGNLVRIFPDNPETVFVYLSNEELDLFEDATEPTTEEIHLLVMCEGKFLELLKHLEKSKLIEV